MHREKHERREDGKIPVRRSRHGEDVRPVQRRRSPATTTAPPKPARPVAAQPTNWKKAKRRKRKTGRRVGQKQSETDLDRALPGYT
jgi:hypothetical protein